MKTLVLYHVYYWIDSNNRWVDPDWAFQFSSEDVEYIKSKIDKRVPKTKIKVMKVTTEYIDVDTLR